MWFHKLRFKVQTLFEPKAADKISFFFSVLKLKNVIRSNTADTKKKLVYYLHGMNTTKNA